MAVCRSINLSFWTDNLIEDEFTPEDKFFYLYLLTNPLTNLCGCYEVSLNHMSSKTGYTLDTIRKLLDRFQNNYKVLKYNAETKEILIFNWHKYNWTKSEKLLLGVENEVKNIKCNEFREFMLNILNQYLSAGKKGKVVIDYDMKATKTQIKTERVKEIAERVINYFNIRCGTNYKATGKDTISHINARLDEGFTEEDFYTVIDKKSNEWSGTDMEKYLRPLTLFSNRFESYLNQKNINKNDTNAFLSKWEDA